MEVPSKTFVFAVHENKSPSVFTPNVIVKSQEMYRHTKHSERSILDKGQKINCM